MTFRLLESSSDIILEAEAPDPGKTLVEAARGFSQITTKGSAVKGAESRAVDVEAPADLARLAVAFVNQLVFFFSTEGFLPAGGTIIVESRQGAHRARGTLVGEAFDRTRHHLGTEVKAATLHDASFGPHGAGFQVRLLLDL